MSIDDLFDQYTSKVLTNKNNVLHASRLYFKFFRSQKNLLNILIMRKQSDLLGAHYEAYLELLLKDLDYTKREDVTLESYVVTFIAAGLHKILIKWAQNGMVESDQTMAKLVEGLFEAAFDFKTDRKS